MPQFGTRQILTVDGSFGEGGGQILRTSLALACVLGRPVQIINIRQGRTRPGLQPQHVTAVRAAAAICHARIEGAELSSSEILFVPGAVRGGEHVFDVSGTTGSAGSASLVLQTVLLPLCFAGHPSTIVVAGGTHVPWSPGFHYLSQVFLPLASRSGVCAELHITKWGWYPVGGGTIVARISPAKALLPISVLERGELVRVGGVSAISNLPEEIAIRQRQRATIALFQRAIDAELEIVSAPSRGKGTLVFLRAEFGNVTVGFDALGAPGKPAEDVADEACRAMFGYLDAPGALDPHLADQIIPYLACAGGKSEFTTSRITQHLLTNIWAVKQFMDVNILVKGKIGEPGWVMVQGVCPK